ncbi:taste receptor type 2 member 46-like [Hipposideros larvatus]
MMSFLRSILCILIIAQFVLGNFANVFIALVNCIDWVKRQKISIAHGNLTALAVSRVGLLWVLGIYWYGIMFNPALYSVEIRFNVYVALIISNHFSLWLATSLSVFYLLKIANFSNLLFLHLKRKVKRVIFMILLGALVLLVFHLAVVGIAGNTWVSEYEGNFTSRTKFGDINYVTNMALYTAANVIPFTTSLTCFVLLIFSLWKHLKYMQFSGKGSQDPSTKVHIRAMQTVISFLLLFAIYTVAQVFSAWSSNRQSNDPIILCFQVLEVLYPSGHSFVLIWGNKKLKQDFLSLLRLVRC